jgi:hypothetical protein
MSGIFTFRRQDHETRLLNHDRSLAPADTSWASFSSSTKRSFKAVRVVATEVFQAGPVEVAGRVEHDVLTLLEPLDTPADGCLNLGTHRGPVLHEVRYETNPEKAGQPPDRGTIDLVLRQESGTEDFVQIGSDNDRIDQRRMVR